MRLQKFALADASFERAPDQKGDIDTGNLVDQRHGGPITIGYGRYGPDQVLEETMAVHDVMIILEGKLTVTSGDIRVTAGPGEIIYMPQSEAVKILSHELGATTAYVTYPHWKEGRE
ncbi:ethanolamine utilization protein [Aliihoeflea sp. PC F10.4]